MQIFMNTYVSRVITNILMERKYKNYKQYNCNMRLSVQENFLFLCGVLNLNTTAEIKSSILQSPWHMVSLQLEEKLRILTKVKVFNDTFCYAMGSLL